MSAIAVIVVIMTSILMSDSTVIDFRVFSEPPKMMTINNGIYRVISWSNIFHHYQSLRM